MHDQRVGPAFGRLRASLDDDADPLLLRSDPTALAPESLLVFDVAGPIRDFARAAAAVAGLDLIAEEETGEEDEDGLYYLFVPDGRALAQIESLYTRWKEGSELGDFGGFAELFGCLRDLRRWSAQDRVNAADAIALQDLAAEYPDQPIGVEIELVFHADERRAMPYEEEVAAAVHAVGGRILDRGRHEGFASHALLAALPAAEVLAIAERRPGSLADLHPVFSIGPQATIDVFPDEAEDAGTDRGGGDLPTGEPVVALFDAVPIQGHARLAGRLTVDDPEDLEGLSIGLRLHGTAMASLIVHGDLNRAGEPVRRPIYVRPLLYAPIPGEGREVFRPERLVVDAFYDAVVRMKVGGDGRPPSAPGVVVVNVSLGDNRRRFSRRLSRWARALDDLASRFGILFVVSAGNLDIPGVDDVPLPGLGCVDDLLATEPRARMQAFLGGLRDDMRDRGLLAPAEAVNALTVGSAHDDAVDPRPPANGPTIDPYPEARLPNLTSAPGPGFAGAVKPDVLLPGGRERVVAYEDGGLFARARPASAAAGLRVAGPARLAQSIDATTFSGQTSAAAALATRTAHRIHDALEDAYGDVFLDLDSHARALVLKALLVHRARWSPEAVAVVDAFCPPDAHWTRKRAHASRLLGNGFLDMDEAVACAANRATAWATGSLECGRGAVFDVPMPASLGAPTLTPHAVTVTLAWFSPTLPGRRAYRQARFKILEPNGEELGRLGMEPAKGQPSPDSSRRGTVVQRVFSGAKAAALKADDRLSFKVQREADLGGPVAGNLHFAVAATVEAEGDIPVYDEVLVRLAARPRVQVPR